MRLNKAKILAITLIVLVLSGTASSWDPVGWIKEHVVDWIIEQIKKIPERFVSWFVDVMVNFIQGMLAFLKDMIMKNPDPDDIKPLVEDFMEILVPVYVVIIVVLGIYIIFVSISPSGRAKAKSIFWKILLSMVLVSLSLQIFEILLTISEALAQRMMAGTVTTNIPQFTGLRLTSPWSILALVMLLFFIVIPLALISIGLRYILVLVFCAIFPFTLFLYFFEFTKSTGAKILRYTMAAIFAQVVQALMLTVTILSINSVSMQNVSHDVTTAHMWLIAGGCLMIALAPLLMMGLMQWIGGAIAGIGMVVSFVHPVLGSAMVSAGAVAAGMGPGGLVAGGTAYGLGRMYRQSAGLDKEKKERKREKREEKKRLRRVI